MELFTTYIHEDIPQGGFFNENLNKIHKKSQRRSSIPNKPKAVNQRFKEMFIQTNDIFIEEISTRFEPKNLQPLISI